MATLRLADFSSLGILLQSSQPSSVLHLCPPNLISTDAFLIIDFADFLTISAKIAKDLNFDLLENIC